MKRLLLSFMAICSLASVVASQPSHPAFIFSQEEVPQMRQRVEREQWLQDLRDVVVADADHMLSISTTPYQLVDDGESLYFGVQGRGLQVRVLNLAMAGYLTGDERYLLKSKEILVAVARQTEPDNTKHWNKHLQASDAAQGFALGYDLLYNYMSEKERKLVREEIEKFGNYLYSHAGGWDDLESYRSSCNHNSVHHGALGLCALVLGDKPEWLYKSIQRMEAFFTYSADKTGYVTEGHHYLSYGYSGAMPFTIALQRVTGFDLLEKYKDVLSKVGDQIVWSLLPNRELMVMNDSYSAPMGDIVAFGGMIYNRPEQLWSWLELAKYRESEREMNLCERRCRFYAGYGEQKRGVYVSAPMGIPYTRCYMFAPMAKYITPLSPANRDLPLTKRFESGRVFMRSGWRSEDDAHLSFTSGVDYHYGHNHQDENSLTLYALGETFLYDAAYWAKYSYCHSTLKIDGREQWVAFRMGSHTRGEIEACREDESGSFARGEARGAYDKEAGVAESNRKIYLVRDTPFSPFLIMRDDAYMVDRSSVEYETRFITRPEHRIIERGEGVVIETKSGAKALMLTRSGTQAVKMSENDLTGETFSAHVNGGIFNCADYFRRISAKVTAQNPRFTTILLPYRDECELPKVEVGESGDDIIYTFTFAGGESRVVRLSYDNIEVE